MNGKARNRVSGTLALGTTDCLHHVFKTQVIIASMLLTWHNLRYYQELMAGLRGAIAAGDLASHVQSFHERQSEGDLPAL
jgi:queuine tRNA-ribosyltransferase